MRNIASHCFPSSVPFGAQHRSMLRIGVRPLEATLRLPSSALIFFAAMRRDAQHRIALLPKLGTVRRSTPFDATHRGSNA
jgi:hypothetical protein